MRHDGWIRGKKAVPRNGFDFSVFLFEYRNSIFVSAKALGWAVKAM